MNIQQVTLIVSLIIAMVFGVLGIQWIAERKNRHAVFALATVVAAVALIVWATQTAP